MKIATTKRAEIIRRFLLASIKAGNNEYMHDAMETFDLSRQAIHAHLSQLVKMGFLNAIGNTRGRTYALGPVRAHFSTLKLNGLQESDVYRHDFGFIFKDLPRELENICHYGFTEILNNAIDHSEGNEVKITVDRTRDKIKITIADDGEGIFIHVARLLQLTDPRESLLELSKGKLTTDPANHTGQGIFFTSRAFDKFVIFSGDLVFSHVDGQHNDWLLHDDENNHGTYVAMEIALSSDRTLKEVFDKFTGNEDDDFAFNKTVVPVRLALYEGESLVSRSQAKRILNRVEKFSTVILDFAGVQSIGQAFADEVFRVFARAHPQIKLISVEENDDVKRMIHSAKHHP